MKRRIAVAMSGGVDSSVSAYLLQKLYSPYADIIGLHMNNWNSLDDEGSKTSSSSFCVQSERDAADAQKVCDFLNIRMHRVSFATEYWTNVFEPFLNALEEGLMPNPDVGCNTKIKFGAMRNYAMTTLKADFVATGHYAQLWHRHECNSNENDTKKNIRKTSRDPPDFVAKAVDDSTRETSWLYDWGYKNSIPLLLAGADGTKDQSYFLAGVNGEAFCNTLFPIGHLMKNVTNTPMNKTKDAQDLNTEEMSSLLHSSENTVRSIASVASLCTSSKRDSMGICFIGKRNFSDFVNGYLPPKENIGNFIDIDTGRIVGQYKTSTFFTKGQGSKISGASHKWFITKMDKERDIIYVCSDTHHPSLYSSELYVKVKEFNWICGEIPSPLISESYMHVYCRIRHLQPLIPAVVVWDRINQMFIVRFHAAVRAVTAGQMCVLYAAKGTVCLGGGAIWKSGETFFERNCPLPTNLHPSGNNDLSCS